MSIHRIREGDDRPYFRTTLKLGGAPVDLTGAAVEFRMEDESGVNKITRSAAIIQSSPTVDKGVVEFRFDSSLGETDLPGKYFSTFQVLFPDGSEQNFPTRGRDRVHVIRRIS